MVGSGEFILADGGWWWIYFGWWCVVLGGGGHILAGGGWMVDRGIVQSNPVAILFVLKLASDRAVLNGNGVISNLSGFN